MKQTWKDNLYEAFRISVYIFTLIMLLFGCLYVRDQHWLDQKTYHKAIRTVQADGTKEIVVASSNEELTPEETDLWQSFASQFEHSWQSGSVPYAEMVDTLLESELAQSVFTPEELEELRKTKELSLELVQQIMEKYQNAGG